jgi:hypothetical protein
MVRNFKNLPLPLPSFWPPFVFISLQSKILKKFHEQQYNDTKV